MLVPKVGILMHVVGLSGLEDMEVLVLLPVVMEDRHGRFLVQVALVIQVEEEEVHLQFVLMDNVLFLVAAEAVAVAESAQLVVKPPHQMVIQEAAAVEVLAGPVLLADTLVPHLFIAAEAAGVRVPAMVLMDVLMEVLLHGKDREEAEVV